MMRITVITVCYNSAKTIEKTIQSVISQRYHDLEYLIVDGGSTDGTLDIVRKYRADISMCISEPDRGIYDAMNKGLERADGDVIAFLNSDDWYISEADVFNKVEQYFSRSAAEIVSGGIYQYCDGESIKIPRVELTRENIFFEIVCPHPAMFVKKELYQKLGKFDLSYKIAADTKWTVDAYMSGANILCVEDYFTCFRAGGISTTRRYASLKEQYDVMRSCARQNHLTCLEEQINSYYTDGLRQMERENCLEKALYERQEAVRMLFDSHKTYCIWGAGIRGRQCLKLFEMLGICVEAFIDVNKKQDMVGEYPVVKPEELDTKSQICITPKGCESEIRAQLGQMGISEDRILSYSWLMDKIVQIGSGEQENYGVKC